MKQKTKLLHGTRGWHFGKEKEDKKIADRELIRLELSIKEGIQKYGETKQIIICMHYPPTTKELLENSPYIKLMQKYNINKCIYGHLHGEAIIEKIEGNIGGIELKLVSCDALNFRLAKIEE